MQRTLRLTELPTGQAAVLADFSLSRLHQRLLSMGISPGTPAVIIRRLPAHGSLYIKFGERNLALRYAEAELIRVTHV